MLLISVIDYEEVDTNRWNFVLHTAFNRYNTSKWTEDMVRCEEVSSSEKLDFVLLLLGSLSEGPPTIYALLSVFYGVEGIRTQGRLI